MSDDALNGPGESPSLPSPAEFDWLVYADATFAGLSPLIPVPLLDLAFEWLFRRRMPGAIARRRGRKLAPAIVRELNRGKGCREGCLTWPIKLTLELLKRLSRKILYFLAIKEATDQLSYYWHRAFLLDYMVQRGYLDDAALAHPAGRALEKVLDHPHISPLNQLAYQIVGRVSHIFRTLRGARRGKEDEVIEQTRSLMARTWENFGDYFAELSAEYDETYKEVRAQLAAEEAARQAAEEAARQAAAAQEAQDSPPAE
ncbi:MAG: hypothetical protein L0322_22015 [Chloroflexi bacterium]|nr:hypothetical protein [Chloroflexota bacterium]MCI0575483.1 hypothetical protein [Chloroflexota bacterium]MCI0646665.1 hypothetical protein [Chloroflexota bacterium]